MELLLYTQASTGACGKILYCQMRTKTAFINGYQNSRTIAASARANAPPNKIIMPQGKTFCILFH